MNKELQKLLKHRRQMLVNKLMRLPHAKRAELRNITSLSRWAHFHPWCTTGMMFVWGASLGNSIIKCKEKLREQNTNAVDDKSASFKRQKYEKAESSPKLFDQGLGFLSSYISSFVVSQISRGFAANLESKCDGSEILRR